MSRFGGKGAGHGQLETEIRDSDSQCSASLARDEAAGGPDEGEEGEPVRERGGEASTVGSTSTQRNHAGYLFSFRLIANLRENR